MLKILLVDDNPGDQKLFKEAIQETGIEHQLYITSSAQECLAMMGNQRPDLIFMDVILPGLMGGDFVQMLQKDPRSRSIPVVFLTGMVGERTGEGCLNKLNIGGSYFPALGKPVNSRGILEVITLINK